MGANAAEEQENVIIATDRKYKVQADIITNADHVTVRENAISATVQEDASIVTAREEVKIVNLKAGDIPESQDGNRNFHNKTPLKRNKHVDFLKHIFCAK